MQDGKDGKKENFWGRVQKFDLVGARWDNKQAGASQCWQERDTANIAHDKYQLGARFGASGYVLAGRGLREGFWGRG